MTIFGLHPATARPDLGPRFAAAIANIDAANVEDPQRITVGGKERPKELVHAELATGWVLRLRSEAPETLILAARAHHIRRWQIPRSTYPANREGYLQWREGLYQFHADTAADILHDCGYEDAIIARVGSLIRKERIKTDPDAQTLEDALCLVFFETQLDDVAEQLDEDRLLRVLRRTWRKMSDAGRDAALALPLSARARAALERALSTT